MLSGFCKDGVGLPPRVVNACFGDVALDRQGWRHNSPAVQTGPQETFTHDC
jgi:hypothetical protein